MNFANKNKKDIKRIQKALKADGFDPGPIDGIAGPLTKAATSRWEAERSTWARGIDVSSYQTSIDWQKVAADGVSFVIARSSVSIYHDRLFASHIRGAKAAGLLVGAYHFFAPWRGVTAQVDLILSQLNNELNLPLVLDVEALAPKPKKGKPLPIAVNKSLRFSLDWLPRLKPMVGDVPLYLAVQDGMNENDVRPHLLSVQGIFVGGTDPWKKSTVAAWAKLAHENGLLCHLGRAGTFGKVRLALEVGVDSIDSSLPLMSQQFFADFFAALCGEDKPHKSPKMPRGSSQKQLDLWNFQTNKGAGDERNTLRKHHTQPARRR